MTPRDFLYWLQGFAELSESGDGLSAKHWLVIKDHMELAMTKETPDRSAFGEVEEDERQQTIWELIEESRKEHGLPPHRPHPFRIPDPYEDDGWNPYEEVTCSADCSAETTLGFSASTKVPTENPDRIDNE